jgi:hypothetical protein
MSIITISHSAFDGGRALAEEVSGIVMAGNSAHTIARRIEKVPAVTKVTTCFRGIPFRAYLSLCLFGVFQHAEAAAESLTIF